MGNLISHRVFFVLTLNPISTEDFGKISNSRMFIFSKVSRRIILTKLPPSATILLTYGLQCIWYAPNYHGEGT